MVKCRPYNHAGTAYPLRWDGSACRTRNAKIRPITLATFSVNCWDGVKTIDAVCDRSLKCIGQASDLRNSYKRTLHATFLILMTRIPESRRAYASSSAKNGCPSDFSRIRPADHRRNRFNSQTLADQCLHIIKHHGFQFDQAACQALSRICLN